MRRLVVSVLCASGLVLTGAGTAFAEEAPKGTAQAQAGKKVCKITDDKLPGLSGLVATDDGFVVINDSNPQDSRKRVFFLDAKCKVKDSVGYSGSGPLDTEDMVLSADGKTLWIADIGDNDEKRPTVALWSMPLTGKTEPKIHRLKYPDGGHDAEALLLNGDGTPIIVTKEVGKAAGLYTPAAKLKTNNPAGDAVPLKRVGEISVPASDTPGNQFARIGKGSIDGGAVALNGTKVALRTYTDALEWDVTGGDVLAAVKAKPRVTPLPNEPLGEAIAYSPDGKYFYTVSDMENTPEQGAANYILRYTPSTAGAPVVKSGAGKEQTVKAGPSWFQSLDLNDITYLVAGVGVIGLILVGVGIFGIRRHRKNAPVEPVALKKAEVDDGPKPSDAATELLAVGGAPSGPGVYGAGGAARGGGGGGKGGGPGVYGAKPAAGGPGVYGGDRQPAGAGAGRPPAGVGGRPAAGPRPPGGGGRPPVVNGRPGGGRPPVSGPPSGGGRPPVSGAPSGGGRPPVSGAPSGGGRPPVSGAPSGGGRPPQGGGRPPQGGARPAQGGGGRPAQEGGRPPQGGGRPPQGGARPPQGGGRPPQGGGGRPPQDGGRPAQGGGGRPPQGGGRPQGGAPQGGGTPPGGRPPQGGQPRPAQGGGRPAQGGGRPPQGGQPRPPQGGQPRPPQGGGGRPGGGVYGAQPPGGRSRDVDDDQNHGRTYGR